MLHPDVIMSVKDTTVEKRQANREYKKRTQKYVINSVTFIQALSTHKCYWSHQGLRVFAFLKVKPTKHGIHITHWDLLQLFPACTSSQKSCSPGRAEGETYMWSHIYPQTYSVAFLGLAECVGIHWVIKFLFGQGATSEFVVKTYIA